MPDPPTQNTTRIKKALIDAGFEVFRTRPEEIVLAERPRENLIMDSGVRLRLAPLGVWVVVRSQKADYPHDDEPKLFERARALAAILAGDGFEEIATAVSKVADPGDPERTLDTFYEVTFGRESADLDEAFDHLRRALAIEKRA